MDVVAGFCKLSSMEGSKESSLGLPLLINPGFLWPPFGNSAANDKELYIIGKISWTTWSYRQTFFLNFINIFAAHPQIDALIDGSYCVSGTFTKEHVRMNCYVILVFYNKRPFPTVLHWLQRWQSISSPSLQ